MEESVVYKKRYFDIRCVDVISSSTCTNLDAVEYEFISPPAPRNRSASVKTVRLSLCYLAELRRIVSDLTRHSSLLRCATRKKENNSHKREIFIHLAIFHETYTILDLIFYIWSFVSKKLPLSNFFFYRNDDEMEIFLLRLKNKEIISLSIYII